MFDYLSARIEDLISKTNMFCSVYKLQNGSMYQDTSLQCGIIRTNCVDCLDRTNAFQKMVGIKALSRQLISLGISSDSISISHPLAKSVIQMYEDMGDVISFQYGGSHAQRNAVEGKSRINFVTNFFISISRYVSNSFLDSKRQDSLNLLLGVYRPYDSYYHMWEIKQERNLHYYKTNFVMSKNWMSKCLSKHLCSMQLHSIQLHQIYAGRRKAPIKLPSKHKKVIQRISFSPKLSLPFTKYISKDKTIRCPKKYCNPVKIRDYLTMYPSIPMNNKLKEIRVMTKQNLEMPMLYTRMVENVMRDLEIASQKNTKITILENYF